MAACIKYDMATFLVFYTRVRENKDHSYLWAMSWTDWHPIQDVVVSSYRCIIRKKEDPQNAIFGTAEFST